MKKPLLLLFCTIWALPALASHILGGHITFTKNAEAGPNVYQIKTTLYTDARNLQADRPEIEINCGDGTTLMLMRKSLKEISKSVNEQIFEAVHNYPQKGEYSISFTDAGRFEASNIIGNSTNFHLKTLLVIDEELGCNNSPQFVAPPIFYAAIQHKFTNVIQFYDEENDSVTVEVAHPLTANGAEIKNYKFPDSAFLKNQQLRWKPQQEGSFALAFKVTEYRNSRKISEIQKEWICRVQPASVHFLQINIPCNIKSEAACFYDARNQQDIKFSVKAFSDAVLQLKMYAADVFTIGNEPKFSFTDPAGIVIGNFEWQPQQLKINSQPLQFVIRAKTDGSSSNLATDVPVNILVEGDAEECELSTTLLKRWHNKVQHYVHPNPFTSYTGFYVPDLPNGYTLTLYDRYGRIVNVYRTFQQHLFIYREHLQAGLYIYVIHAKQGINYSGKILIID